MIYNLVKYFESTIKSYTNLAPVFFTAIICSFFLTPIVGLLARNLGIIDLPSALRKPTDESKKTRIKKEPTLRAGALAVIIPLLILLLITGEISRSVIAIIIGITLLTIYGILDDKYEIPSLYQFIFQILAALIVVASGISIDSIQNPVGGTYNLRAFVIPFSIGNSLYSIALPADILTILWILIIINAVNWIFGIDCLGEGITLITFILILLISVKQGNHLTALIAAINAGGLIGFIPFNFYPSKIISGSSVVVYGFLIAVLSILGGVKVSSSVIVLAIPLIDMLWVMIGRINRNGVSSLSQTIKVTTKGDDTHLHHRLLRLGLSIPQVMLVECIAVGICAIVAFYSANLPKVTIISILSVIILVIFFLLSILLKNGISLKRKKKIYKPRKMKNDTPESRYAY